MSSRKQTIGAALSVVIAIVLLILIWLPDKKNQLGENTVAITESETTTSDQKNSSDSASSLFQIGDSVDTNQFEFRITDAYVLDNLGEEKRVPGRGCLCGY